MTHGGMTLKATEANVGEAMKMSRHHIRAAALPPDVAETITLVREVKKQREYPLRKHEAGHTSLIKRAKMRFSMASAFDGVDIVLGGAR